MPTCGRCRLVLGAAVLSNRYADRWREVRNLVPVARLVVDKRWRGGLGGVSILVWSSLVYLFVNYFMHEVGNRRSTNTTATKEKTKEEQENGGVGRNSGGSSPTLTSSPA